MLPNLRGIRLNNPGNIEKGTKWQGLADLQPDPRFCAFVTPEYGVRSICKIIQTYKSKYRIQTITGIITRWAPPHENPTEQYIKNVSEWTGFHAKEILDLKSPEVMAALAKAIIRQENGVQPYEDSVILAGVQMAIKA